MATSTLQWPHPNELALLSYPHYWICHQIIYSRILKPQQNCHIMTVQQIYIYRSTTHAQRSNQCNIVSVITNWQASTKMAQVMMTKIDCVLHDLHSVKRCRAMKQHTLEESAHITAFPHLVRKNVFCSWHWHTFTSGFTDLRNVKTPPITPPPPTDTNTASTEGRSSYISTLENQGKEA